METYDKLDVLDFIEANLLEHSMNDIEQVTVSPGIQYDSDFSRYGPDTAIVTLELCTDDAEPATVFRYGGDFNNVWDCYEFRKAYEDICNTLTEQFGREAMERFSQETAKRHSQEVLEQYSDEQAKNKEETTDIDLVFEPFPDVYT